MGTCRSPERAVEDERKAETARQAQAARRRVSNGVSPTACLASRRVAGRGDGGAPLWVSMLNTLHTWHTLHTLHKEARHSGGRRYIRYVGRRTALRVDVTYVTWGGAPLCGSTRTGRIPNIGREAEPGFIGEQPGMLVIMWPPVSVCREVIRALEAVTHATTGRILGRLLTPQAYAYWHGSDTFRLPDGCAASPARKCRRCSSAPRPRHRSTNATPAGGMGVTVGVTEAQR